HTTQTGPQCRPCSADPSQLLALLECDLTNELIRSRCSPRSFDSVEVLPTRRLPRASGRFRNVSSSPRDCTCSARITVMTRPRRVEQDEGTYIEHHVARQALLLKKEGRIRK